VNGQHYLILAYTVGLGLLLSYVLGLWFAARGARKCRATVVVKAVAKPTPGGVL